MFEVSDVLQCPTIFCVQVVRCFEDDDIVHVAGKVDPLEDIDVINLELALADLGQIEKRLERLRKGEQRHSGCASSQFCPVVSCQEVGNNQQIAGS